MPLTVQSRRVGDIMVVKCIGRLIAGAECESLQQQMGEWLAFDHHFVLDLSAVDFIDSSGLGALVRLLGRAKAARGNLKLCALPKQVSEVLSVTSLDKVFSMHATEAEAIQEYYRERPAAPAADKRVSVLCLHGSADVLAYMREILHGAGYMALTANNLLDGRVLLAASGASLVIISSQLRGLGGTQSAESFRKLIAKVPVIELDESFISTEPAEAARYLIEQVRGALAQGASGTAAS